MATVSIFISILSIFVLLVFSTLSGVLLIPVFFIFVLLLSGCFFSSVFETPKYGLVIVSLILSGIMLLLYVVLTLVSSNIASMILFPSYVPYSNIVVFLIILIILLSGYVRAKKHKLLIQRIPGNGKRVQSVSSLSAPEELAKWKKLFDEGTITEEMFNKKRDELLRR